jgi:histidinol-phosphatase
MCHSTTVVAAGKSNRWQKDLDFAFGLARTASTVALDFFGSAASRIKADGTPVGEADLAVDRVLTDLIRAGRPEDAILSEESEPVGASSRRWILDPVDGTVMFLAGGDDWGTHVALEEDGEVVLGVVTRPRCDEMWWAARGAGSWRGPLREGSRVEPRQLHVSAIDRMSGSRMTVWPTEHRADLVGRIKQSALWEEPSGDCLLSLLGGGLEAVCALAGGPWDHAPAVVLVEEAGGRFRDPEGGRRLDLGGGFYTNGLIDTELWSLVHR